MQKMKETMTAAIFDVFERMFYVFLEPISDEYSDFVIESSILFQGTSKGKVRLLFSAGLAESMVQNLLGMQEEEITKQNVEDCIKEAANMVCGNFLGRLDKTTVFDLSMPSFSQPPGKVDKEDNSCMLSFDSDNGRLVAILTLLDK